QRGHVTTVWKARKGDGGDSRFYAVKCYSPPARQKKSGQAEEVLEQDAALAFLAAVKDLDQAGKKGGRCLARIYAFGPSPEGAWYVTDFCESRSLREFIDKRGAVDDAMLRHIVHSVAVACLALRRVRPHQCSHGNLKPSNVLLAGKPQSLRKRPL